MQALEPGSVSPFPGEFVSVEGPSGCGKATLLNVIGLLDLPTSREMPAGTARRPLRLPRAGAIEAAHWPSRGWSFIFQRFYASSDLDRASRMSPRLPMRALGVAPNPPEGPGPAGFSTRLATVCRDAKGHAPIN